MVKEEIMPEIFPGQPVVIRMSGQWEDFNANTALRKRIAWSDVVVTRWHDDSVSISTRAASLLKDAVDSKKANYCALTPRQMKVIRHIFTFNFDK